jgi:hypothetical protein
MLRHRDRYVIEIGTWRYGSGNRQGQADVLSKDGLKPTTLWMKRHSNVSNPGSANMGYNRFTTRGTIRKAPHLNRPAVHMNVFVGGSNSEATSRRNIPDLE